MADPCGGGCLFCGRSKARITFSPLTRSSSASCPNGYEGELSPDAFGIACSLYAYSNLSFNGDGTLARECARQFHRLREYMLGHEEARAIMRAID